MNSSFRNVILMKDFDLLNSVGLAIGNSEMKEKGCSNYAMCPAFLR